MDTSGNDGMVSGPKTGRVRLPKRVAGVKLPKPMRRAAEEALAQAFSPAGRLLLASALEAAATALRRGAASRGSGASIPAATVDRVGPMIGLAASALGSWLGDVARKPAPPAEQALAAEASPAP